MRRRLGTQRAAHAGQKQVTARSQEICRPRAMRATLRASDDLRSPEMSGSERTIKKSQKRL